MPLQDLTGRRFGRLEVLSYSHSERARPFWLCRCDCGATKAVRASYLRRGESTSCGCLRSEQMRAKQTKHGLCESRTYNSWTMMLTRCNNPNSTQWPYYGARGVQVCPEWTDSFDAFLRDMGEAPAGCTIDRIDVRGSYCKENCRWATKAEQARNRRDTVYLTYNGETLPLIDWADRMGVTRPALHARIKKGWPVERALMTPVRCRTTA